MSYIVTLMMNTIVVLLDNIIAMNGLVNRQVTDLELVLRLSLWGFRKVPRGSGSKIYFVRGKRPQTNWLTDKSNGTLMLVLENYFNFNHDYCDQHVG